MTPQVILRIAGIVALVVSVLFAVLAVHYYLTQNIRAVMDDLSGKARARGMAGTRARSMGEARGTRRGEQAAARRPGARKAEVTDEAPSVPAFAADVPDDDDLGTKLVPATVGPAAPGGTEAEATYETAADAGSTGDEDRAPETHGAGLFCVTRRIVMIHAQEIIAPNEG